MLTSEQKLYTELPNYFESPLKHPNGHFKSVYPFFSTNMVKLISQIYF